MKRPFLVPATHAKAGLNSMPRPVRRRWAPPQAAPRQNPRRRRTSHRLATHFIAQRGETAGPSCLMASAKVCSPPLGLLRAIREAKHKVPSRCGGIGSLGVAVTLLFSSSKDVGAPAKQDPLKRCLKSYGSASNRPCRAILRSIQCQLSEPSDELAPKSSSSSAAASWRGFIRSCRECGTVWNHIDYSANYIDYLELQTGTNRCANGRPTERSLDKREQIHETSR